MTAPQLHLPRTVASDQTERAVDLLQLYFKSRKFIGSQWDGFDPSGRRAASANVFTSDDVASAALLIAAGICEIRQPSQTRQTHQTHS